MDVALHTFSFIFGRIDVRENLTKAEIKRMIRKHGIESMVCSSLEDVQACVDWAATLQEQHVRCHDQPKVA